MRTISFILIFTLLGIYSNAQKSSGNYAVIEFVGEKNSNTRTYLGKIKKGDPNRLNDYLQQSKTKENTDDTDQSYAPHAYPTKKEREKFRQLSDIYNIDEKKLSKKKKKYYQKYLEEKKKVYTEEVKIDKKKDKNPNQFSIKDFFKGRKKTKLSKQFKIRGKRLRKGQKLKYPGGNISLIIKFEIRENNTVKTYVTSINSNVKAGSKYLLKFNGNDSKRKYFLMKQP